MALFLSLHAMGQMPYNPDANGDDLIGSEDLLSFLGLYSTVMVDSSLTCSYEGTELESLVGGLFDCSLILDSIYVEYLYSDSVQTFLPGCPDPVYIETILERSYMMTFSVYFGNSPGSNYWYLQTDYLGYGRYMNLYFYNGEGLYEFYITDNEIGDLSNTSATSWSSSSLPFPVDWTLNEDGIQVDWSQDDWVANCEYFRLIPFWSVAQ